MLERFSVRQRFAIMTKFSAPPIINIPKLRSLLAEKRIRRKDFAEAAHMNPKWLSPLLNERYPIGALSAWKLAVAAETYELAGEVVSWPSDELPPGEEPKQIEEHLDRDDAALVG